MGNEIGFIKITNLEGTTKAFGLAADLDQDGKVEGNELAVFNRLVGQAGLNQDQGLIVEREEAGKRGAEAKPQELSKQEDKMYKDCFGLKAGSADLAKLKKDVAEYDTQVINVFKELKNAGDNASIMKLNEIIANRPDMTNYIGDSGEYLKQLAQYANDAKALLEESNREFQANLARGIMENDDFNAEIIMENDDLNTLIAIDTTLAVGAELSAEMQYIGNEIIGEVRAGTAQVIEAVRTAEGNIIQVVKTESGKTRAFITDAKNQIIGVVKEESDKTRFQEFMNALSLHKHIDADGKATRGQVKKSETGLHKHIDADGKATRSQVKKSATGLHKHLDKVDRHQHLNNFNPLNPMSWL